MSTRYRYGSTVQSRRDKVESEAINLGREYMEGRKSIRQVENYLNGSSFAGDFTRTEINKFIMRGVRYAEDEGKAIESRKQPLQEDIGPLKKAPRSKKSVPGRLAARPEHTRYKAPVLPMKAAPKPKRETAARPRALNEYDVKAQRKADLKVLLDKHAKGQLGVREVKKESKAAASGRAYKNVTYNETHHRYVGPNRLGAPPKKEFDYQPKRKRKAKSDSKYLFTYSQGGANNKQVSIMGKTKEQAKSTFRSRYPQAKNVDVRLVMQGD